MLAHGQLDVPHGEPIPLVRFDSLEQHQVLYENLDGHRHLLPLYESGGASQRDGVSESGQGRDERECNGREQLGEPTPGSWSEPSPEATWRHREIWRGHLLCLAATIADIFAKTILQQLPNVRRET